MARKLANIALLALALIVGVEAMAQARIARTEFVCYDKREDAKRDLRSGIDKYIAIAPALQFENATGSVRAVYEQTIEVPASWNDYNAYLHTENVGADYTIFVNGKQVTEPIDRFTPTETFISPYLDQGENTIAIVVVEESYMSLLDEGLEQSNRAKFENCYIFAQRKLGLYDFNVRLVPDSLERFAQLQLDIVANNSFSTDEVIELGYDIYAPDGKLIDYSVNGYEVAGFSRDTVSYTPWVYNSNPNRWSPSNPKLYDLTLYIKLSGILREYIPLKVGFAKYGFNAQGEITAFGKPIAINRTRYNATADRATAEREIKALKAKGFNTLCPDYPQPEWFYDICDSVGIYVIDCAAISSPSKAEDRSVEGTPANMPWLEEEYLWRVEAMYRRAQNHVSIIAFRLAGDGSGNGYNMYKAYERLKSFGDERAIIYEGADGEWNSDLDW